MEEGEQALRKTVDDVVAILYPADEGLPMDQRVDAVRQLVEARFSVEIIARRALGRGWERLRPAQQQRFMDLFGEVLFARYRESFRENPRPPAITWDRTLPMGASRMESRSRIQTASGQYAVFYRLALVDGRWQVYDVIVEGVSMVSNYRSQFESVLERGSPEDLLSALERMAANPASRN